MAEPTPVKEICFYSHCFRPPRGRKASFYVNQQLYTVSIPITSTVAPVVSGLAEYSGPWQQAQAAHLLRRTVFGPSRDEIAQATSEGLAATLDRLFATPTLPSPPLNHWADYDPNVPIGATWVEAPHVEGQDVGKYRWSSLRGWYIQHLIDSPCTIMEKLAMFWVNHFGMSDVGEHRAQYQYIQLFREYGAGSFQEMIERITVHPAMLRFLNGEYSNKWDPNENYGRELLELFTIQKGPQINPGDYSNYTEEDIRVAARVLTGYRNRGMWSREDTPVESYFDADWHHEGVDPSTGEVVGKQLSYHFDNAVIENNGADEYKDLISVIFSKPETARAMCRELYRYFVYYEITPRVESDVIAPLAQFMIDNDFSMELTLRKLFSSEHFYDMVVRGPIIKNPYEYALSILRPLGGFGHLNLSLVNGYDRLQTTYNIGYSVFYWLNNMNMDVFYPPTVAGWKAYYQVPTYYRNWIGSATLQQRRKLVNVICSQGIWTQTEDGDFDPRPLDWLSWVDGLGDAAFDVNEVVQAAVDTFLPRPLDDEGLQFDALKAILTREVNDSEWTLQYSSYIESPDNPDVVNPLVRTIKDFFRAIFSMAEFHLQ